MFRVICIVLCLSLLLGCDYIPHKVYKIKTVSGHVISISCPTIDKGRNSLTYLIDGRCILVK